MISVKVQKISYYHPNRSYAIILKEVGGSRRVPILVGSFEAQSIALAMESIDAPRPLTHDLIVNLIKGINATLSAVKITKVKEGIFYSILDIQSKKLGHAEIDSRPSDALALALRMHCPILVDKKIMKEPMEWREDVEADEEGLQFSPEIEVLEEQLQKAIDKEDYEFAAKIRDKINNIDP